MYNIHNNMYNIYIEAYNVVKHLLFEIKSHLQKSIFHPKTSPLLQWMKHHSLHQKPSTLFNNFLVQKVIFYCSRSLYSP